MEKSWLFPAGLFMTASEIGLSVFWVLGITDVSYVIPPMGSLIAICIAIGLYFLICLGAFFNGSIPLISKSSQGAKTPKNHFWHFVWAFYKYAILLVHISLYYAYEKALGTPTTTDLGPFIWYKLFFTLALVFATMNIISFAGSTLQNASFSFLAERGGVIRKRMTNVNMNNMGN